MLAHSERLVLPTITAPAARRRATSGASRLVTLPASARLPAVVGNGPAASILSLMSTGSPAIPPRWPLASTRLGHGGGIDRDYRMDPRIDRLDPGDGRRRALLCTAFRIRNRRRRLGRS